MGSLSQVLEIGSLAGYHLLNKFWVLMVRSGHEEKDSCGMSSMRQRNTE